MSLNRYPIHTSLKRDVGALPVLDLTKAAAQMDEAVTFVMGL